MKVILFIAIGLVVLLIIGYLAAGYVVYDKLSKVTPYPEDTSYTPSHFQVDYEGAENFDTRSYTIPKYENVTFTSREEGITLVGWYAEASPTAPVVIVTHGIGAGKYAANVLTPAGMLYHHGFNVLLYDMRNHGESTVDNGRTSVGNKEFKDVLGAWDYLVNERGYDAKQVALFGLSLGAGSTLNAFAQEPRIAAAWVDSPFSDLKQIVSEELARTGFPTFLAPAAILAGRVFDGVNLEEHTPKDAIRQDAGRPIFIVHGLEDERINVQHTRELVELAKETNANVDVWYVENATHCMSMFIEPKMYEEKIVSFFTSYLKP